MGLIAGHNLNLQRSRILPMLALTKTTDVEEWMFSEYQAANELSSPSRGQLPLD
jgi:hypothetical protein